jgi:hypothetical protein
MKTLIVLAFLMPVYAYATCTSQTFNNITYTTCKEVSGTSQTFNGITYHQFGDKKGTSQTFGGTTYHKGDLFKSETPRRMH